jgi:hypothetical protein
LSSSAGRVTRCFFGKVALNVAQPVFCKKYRVYVQLFLWKKVAKMWNKNIILKNAKVGNRPIWSPWSSTPAQKYVRTTRVTRLGGFFAQVVIVYFGQLLENYRSVQHLRDTLFRDWVYVCINFDKKSVGLHLGKFFHKLIWSPWALPTLNARKVCEYVQS